MFESVIEVASFFGFLKKGFGRVLETAIEEAASFGFLKKLLFKGFEDGA